MKIYLKKKTTLTCILCLLLLLCGCSSAANKAAVVSPAQPTDAAHPQAAAADPSQPAEPADSVTLSIAEDPSDASPAAPAPVSAEASADPREEVPALLSARQEEACTIGVTRILREKNEDGTWTHTYFNRDVDFTGLGLEVLQYSFTGDTPALRLKVTFPEHWDSDTRSWMQKEGLKLSFRMGDLPVDAYRQRSISSLEDGFLVEYARCLLTEEDYAAYKGLYICPYVEQYYALNKYDPSVRHKTETRDLMNGESFTTVYKGPKTVSREYMSTMRISRIDLNDCISSVPFPETPYRTKPPVYSKLAVVEPLWEENIKNGVYDENAQIPELAKVSLIDKDFSEVRFVLDTFHIWEEEILLVYSVYFPDSWSLYERRSLMNDAQLGISFDLDGIRQPNQIDMYADPPSPIYFGSVGQYTGGSKPELIIDVDYTNYSVMSIPGQHERNWFSRLSVSEWAQKQSMRLIPSYGTFTEVALRMDDNNVIPHTHLTETPITIEYGWGNREHILLEDLAMPVDITPDLFGCGF